jgi:putative transposase
MACGVNRSTFGYRTRPKPPGNRDIRRFLVADAIGLVHEDSRGTYGYRRVQAALRIERAVVVNHKLVASVMADLGLSGLPRRKTRKRNPITVRTTSDLVNRDVTATGPNQLWVSDITEHPTREGTVYACAVLDVTLCNAVGWGIDRRPETSLVNSALHMAWSTRKPVPGAVTHAGHGSQGGFKWLSQHLEYGGVNRWRGRTGVRRQVMCQRGCAGSGVQIGQCGPRCALPVRQKPPGSCNASFGR